MKYLTLMLCAVLVACSGSEEDRPPPPSENVWKSQTDMIERARGVEGLVQDADDRQRERMEEQLK